MEKKFIGNGFEISDLDKIAKVLRDNDLGKIAVKGDDFEIVMESKKCAPPPPFSGAAPALAQPAAQPEPAQTQNSAPAASGNVVKAPIVGTFYASPAPGKEPFVSVGKSVKKGDVIFIIESMKVMSEITCEYDGVVKEILVSDGDAVEFDQPIMIVG